MLGQSIWKDQYNYHKEYNQITKVLQVWEISSTQEATLVAVSVCRKLKEIAMVVDGGEAMDNINGTEYKGRDNAASKITAYVSSIWKRGGEEYLVSGVLLCRV